MLLLTKKRELRWKQFSLCSKHITCSHCHQERLKCSPHALTGYQIVLTLLNCTCMMVWSGFVHSVNSREYCVVLYQKRQFSKEDRTPISTNLFQANNCFLGLKVGVFAESYMKLHCSVTVLFPVTLQCSISMHTVQH